MKRIGLLILVLALILGGVFFLSPGGGGDSVVFDEDAGSGFEEAVGASASLSESEDAVAALDAAANVSQTGLTEAGRRSLETGAVGGIYGQVLDLLSQPVPGAKIFLYGRRESLQQGAQAPVLSRAMSDDQGQFRMQGLQLASYSLRVRAEGWAQSQTAVELTARYPDRLGLRIRLHKGHSISGVVVDAAGKPVPEAWVVASDLRSQGGELIWEEVQADKDGRFAFSSFASTKQHVLAWSPGHSLGLAEIFEAQAESVRVELPALGPYKIAFSLAKQKPSVETQPTDVTAKVLLSVGGRSIPLPSPIRMLRVPAEGMVETRGLREGSYQIHLQSREVALAKTWQQAKLSQDKPTAKVELTWTDFLGLEGQLVFKNGQPAQDVILQTWATGDREALSAKSDREGRFVFPKRFPGGRNRTYISLAEPGFLFESGKNKGYWIQIKPGEKGQVFTLLPVGTMAGVVLDEKDRPVPGARVWLHTQNGGWGSFGQVLTDAQGQFRLSAANVSKKTLWLDASFDSQYCPKPLLMGDKVSLSQEGLVLRLTVGASIAGEVVDKKSHGIENVNVWAIFVPKARPKGSRNSNPGWKLDGNSPFGRRRSVSARTNHEGKFLIRGLTPGSWRVSAKKSGHMKSGVDPVLQMALGQQRSGVRFVFNEGLSIQGRLVTDRGKPLANTRVSARFEGRLAKGEAGGRADTKTGIDGSFTLGGLRPGKFKLTARLSWQMQTELGLRKPGPDGKRAMRGRSRIEATVMAGIRDYRWTYPLPRFGEIRARFAQSGKPLQRIQVEFRDGKKRWTFDLPVVQGAVIMKRVLTGSYDLTFKSKRHEDVKLEVQVQAEQVVDLGLLNLEDLETVMGRVTDEQGTAIAGVWISLDAGVTRLWPNYDLSKGAQQFDGRVLTQTDAQGRFSVPIKGGIRIFGFKPGYAPGGVFWAKPKAKNAKKAKKAKKAAGPKELILVLKRAGEVTVEAPVPAKGKNSRWYARLTRIPVAPPPASKKAPRPWSKALALKPGEPVRFLGLLPGRYHLEAANWTRIRSYQKKSVLGKNYYEELLIQTGSHLLIRIP